MNKLTDKIALVTGGGSGIGREIAKRLANDGAKVIIIGRSEEPLQQTALFHTGISYLIADITSSHDLNVLAQT